MPPSEAGTQAAGGTAPRLPDAAADPVAASRRERVRQIHHAYLDALYATEYFKAVHARTTRYARHFDFAIGLGAAVSGGSGLGILGDPAFAWACGVFTTVSFILTVAKAAYDWPGKLKSAAEMVEAYGRLSGRLLALVQDMNYRRSWQDEFDAAFVKLRDEEASFSADIYPPLPATVQAEIQAGIKRRVKYNEWWTP